MSAVIPMIRAEVSSLTELDQWVLADFKKAPMHPNGTMADSGKPETWSTYELCGRALKANRRKYSNLGFVFSDKNDIAGIDLDGCFDEDDKLKPWAVPLVQTFYDTYMERSPSGKGLHIIFFAKLSLTGLKVVVDASGNPIHVPHGQIPKEHPDYAGGIEIYTSGRYFTVTWNRWNDASLDLEEHTADVQKLYNRLSAQRATQKAPEPASADPAAKVGKGARHNFLFSSGCKLRRVGAGEEAILAELRKRNQECCEPPYDDAHLVKLAASVVGSYQPHPRASLAGTPAKQADTSNNVDEIISPTSAAQQADGDSNWRQRLILSAAGNIRAVFANAVTALRFAPEWAGVLAFNEFSLQVHGLKSPPWSGTPTGTRWKDQEIRLTCNWLQHRGILVSPDVTGQAIETVARDRSYHPVREYLNGLHWDGRKRLDNWLSTYLGVEPSAYVQGVGARWLISAVARIERPGAKVDCALIAEGPQGILKSTSIKTLCPDPSWFTDEIAELGSKDSAMQVSGVWIIEIAELDSMARSEVSKIKAFMSRSTDRFRPPYGKHVIDAARQSVFFGSVNSDSYLRDETGNRRFWPVRCTDIKIDELARDRDQLWGEALIRFRANEKWWLDSKELNDAAAEEQAARFDSDIWEEPIARWLDQEQPDQVTVLRVLTAAVRKAQEHCQPADKNRAARCLTALGWERRKLGPRGARFWAYVPKDTPKSR